MAWRETRAAWRHFLYFFICIALGVAAVVAVSLFGTSVGGTVMREARSLMAADLEIRLSHQLSEQGKDVFHALDQRGVASVHVSELVAMASTGTGTGTGAAGASPTAKSQVIELKAVAEGYPFYGALKVEPDQSLMSLLQSTPCPVLPDPPTPYRSTPVPCHGAVVQESLLIRMGLRVGEPIKIGEAWFTITGILRKEPDRSAGAFSLGPRVMISQDGLLASALIKPGIRVRERYLLRLPVAMEPDPLLHELRGRLAQESARVLPYRDAQPQLRRFLDQLARYLGLIGLTALFVGGIGVASSVSAFLREKLHTIAVLKTLGADSRLITGTYLLQALILGGIGSLAGVFLGAALQQTLPSLLRELLPGDLSDLAQPHSLWSPASVGPVLKGLLLGLSTTLLFSIWPLLAVGRVQPASIFRGLVEDAGPQPGTADRPRLIAGLLIVTGLAGLAVWQAGTWKIGLVFMGALIGAVLALQLGARGLIRLAVSIRRPRSLAWRQAIGNVYRPGSQAIGVMMSIGIGVMVIVAVSLLEVALTDQLHENRPTDAPSFFFIDIQPDQHDEFRRLLESLVPHAHVETTPLVRSRLHALNGERVQVEETAAPDQGQERERGKSWYFTREYVLTVRDQLPRDNTVSQGAWWRPGQTFAVPQVSVEEEAAKNLRLQLGSSVEFDIQGTTLAAEVASIRKVEWNNFSTNFYMILSPGSLEGAPMTYVATIRVPPDLEIPLQQAVVAAFPNVTAINIRDVMDTFVQMLERLSLAIRAVALFCILTSAVVMAGALAATRYRRLYESVIFKALGATRGLIARTFAAEYALLGAAAGLVGVLLASVLSWALLTYILDLSWALHLPVLAAGFLLTILLTLAVGFLSTFRILGHPPLAVLRQE
jgi:putative ABC transport system permease protein